MKPPFSISETAAFDDPDKAVADLAASLPSATFDGLEFAALCHFLALTPRGDVEKLRQLAGACVRDLDTFRTPATEAEIARRHKAGSSARQEAVLMARGYPYVYEEFRFHLTLSGHLSEDALQRWTTVLQSKLPDLPAPFLVHQIALCGERADGWFELIQRYALSG